MPVISDCESIFTTSHLLLRSRLACRWSNAQALIDQFSGQAFQVYAGNERFPMIPALKSATSHCSGEAGWLCIRPLLVELSDEKCSELLGLLNAEHFEMPKLKSDMRVTGE